MEEKDGHFTNICTVIAFELSNIEQSKLFMYPSTTSAQAPLIVCLSSSLQHTLTGGCKAIFSVKTALQLVFIVKSGIQMYI